MSNNNTLATAMLLDLIGSPQSISGDVGTSDRNDFYKFVLAKNSRINLTLSGLSEPAQIAIVADVDGDEVVDSGENIELDTISDFSDSIADRSLIRDLSAGTYWIKVYTYRDYQNTAYTLDASAAALPTAATDPGGNYETAFDIGQLIDNPQTFSDAVGSSDRRDYYQFTLDENAEVSFNLSGLNEPANIALLADFDGDGIVDSNEDVEFDTVSVFSDSLEDRSLVRSLAKGTYWTSVYTYRNYHNTAYTLNASATALPTAATDPGGNYETAFDIGQLIDNPQTFSDAVGSSDRRDYYQFTLDENAEVSFNLSGLNEPANIALLADFDGDGIVDSNEDVEFDTVSVFSDSLEDRSLVRSLAKGTYWTSVYTYRNYHNTAYTLNASATALPTAATDPGGNYETAFDIGQLIDNPQTFSDAVGSSDRRDYYQFTLDENAEVSFNLSGLSEPANIALLADFDGDGIVDSNEDVEFDTVSVFSDSLEDRSLVRSLAKGTYWTSVYTYRNYHNTAYTLDASARSTAAAGPVDPGNRPDETAFDLGALGTKQVSDVVGVNDRNDYYKFTISQPTEVTLQLLDLTDDADLELAIDIDGNGQISSNELLASARFSDNRDRTIQQALASGTYFARVYTDSTNDNTAYSLVASSELTTIDAPNLVLTGANAPSTAGLRETISVDWTVKNEGSVDAIANWYDAIYISDDQTLDISDTRITTNQTGEYTPLAVGDSYTEAIDITLPSSGAGDRYLLFLADNFGYQGETSEADNLYTLPISITAPNLVLSDATSPNTAKLNETIEVSFDVANKGDNSISGSWYDEIYLSTDQTLDTADTRLDSVFYRSSSALAVDDEYTVSRSIFVPNTVAAGNQYLLFATDSRSDQGETDELDNFLARPINLEGPDLVLSNASKTGSAVPDEILTVDWTVQNRGSAIANRDWSDYVYLSTDDVLDDTDIRLSTVATGEQTPLAVGDSYSISRDIRIPQSVLPGSYHLIFSADGSQNQGELEENNNQFALPVQVTGRDLTVSEATAPESADLGDRIDVSWTIENDGDAPAKSGWVDQVYLSSNATFDDTDRLIASVSSASQLPLAPRGSYAIDTNVYLPNDTATGSQYLLFVADGENEEKELKEDNNVVAKAIELGGPDLAATNAIAPETASLGETISLSWTVENSGEGSALAPTWTDQIFISSDETLDDTDTLVSQKTYSNTSGVATGQSYNRQENVSIPNSVAAGGQYLLFAANGDSKQGETNRENNVAARQIDLAGPDLTLSDSSSPETIQAGKVFDISWQVSNQGTADALADQWYDYVYLSSDETLSNNDQFITSKQVSLDDGIAPGENYTLNSSVFIPTNASTGDRYLLFVTDRESSQGEIDESNNVSAVPINVASGSFTEDTTWSGVIVISELLTIPEGVTLTIEPGTVVKFAGRSSGLNVKGTVDAPGTLEKPVVFTSWLDDQVGGNTNSVSDLPGVGDWQGITFSGDSSAGNFEHTTIRYANRAINGTQRGASVTLDNAKLTHNNYGIYVYTPLIEVNGNNLLVARNSLTGIFMRADSRGVFRNSTIVENGFSGSGWTAAGIHQGASNLTVENSIIAFNRIGWDHSGDSPLTTVNHSIFYNPDGQETVWNRDAGRPDLTENGNRIADPLFVNRFKGNYQLLAGSPAIDAGTSIKAPVEDILGQARFDDVGIANRGTGPLDYVDIGTYEYRGRTDSADLSVTQVTNPSPKDIQVGETFLASWTVANEGEVDAAGSWEDRVYLSSDAFISADDLLIETREQSRTLAPGASYTETISATVPVAAGPQYILVTTDAEENITESDEINNSRTSSQTLAVDVPSLSVGTPISGTLQPGEWTYFRISTDKDETVRLDLDATVANKVSIYSRYGAPPTLTSYDAVSTAQQSGQSLHIEDAKAGDYYIGVYGQSLNQAASFTLTPEDPAPALYEVVQSALIAGGPTTIELVGDSFTDTDTLKLIAPDGITELLPISVQNQDSTRTFATFDLAEAVLGAYSISFGSSTGADVISLPNVISINDVRPSLRSDVFSADIDAPSYVRPGREVTVKVDYQNLSGSDLRSPLLNVVSNQEIEWKLPGTDQWITDTSVSLLALSKSGPAASLRAGETNTFDIKIRTPLNTEPLNFELYGLQANGSGNSNQRIDWDELEAQSRPTGLSDEAWGAIWDNVQAQTGETWADFVAMLGENAAYLKTLGRKVYDAGSLLAFEVLQANSLSSEAYLAAGEDAFVAAPGLDLRFVRIYGQPLSSRYTNGPLGYGWTHNYDLYVQEANEGEVLVRWVDGSLRSFVINEQGDYVGGAGEDGTLTRNSDGNFQLRESSGLIYRFGANAMLASISDSNGNTITSNYTDGLLTGLSHSSGQSLTLEYTAGSLVKLTDSNGRTSTYKYDTTGDFLEEIQLSNGQTTTYSYDTTNRSLKTVSNAEGNTLSYDYDEQGRLEAASLNDEAERVSYNYDVAGRVTVTDDVNSSSELFFDERGLISQIQDAEGRIYKFEISENGNLTQINQPDGSVSEIFYDEANKPKKIVDAAKNTTSLQFDSTYGDLQWIRDSKGNTQRYDYDSAGNLEKITYPDDSFEKFEIDSKGNLKSYTNRRNQTVSYQYNEDGLISKKTNKGEQPTSYTYDQQGRLKSVTNGQGITKLDYGPEARLKKITYPNNRFLTFEYDEAERRTRLTGSNEYDVKYHYDDVGRLKQLTDGEGTVIVEYTYSDIGRLVKEIKGNGTYTTYEYYKDGQLKDIVHYAPDSSVNSSFSYTYDQLGKQDSSVTLDGTWNYDYDLTGQLISAAFVSDNPQVSSQSFSYAYDSVGNRIRTIQNEEITEYTVNSLNQYETVGDIVYSYDDDGNLTKKVEGDQTWEYFYDIDNRLTKVIQPNDSIVEYEYDIFGNRTSVVEDERQIEYLIDPTGLGNTVAKYSNDSKPIQYLYGIGLESQFSSDDIKYYDFDDGGSTSGLTGSNGTYVNRYTYQPFGQEIEEFESIENDFEFLGQWGIAEEADDIYYMRARHYEPNLGQFMSDDPVGLLGGDHNLRRYVGNDPINWIDPVGLGSWRKRPLANGNAWISTNNRWSPGNWWNTELSHEHFFFDNPTIIEGYNNNVPVNDIGFGPNGLFHETDQSVLDGYKDSKSHTAEYDDELIAEAIKDTVLEDYDLFPILPKADNCQSWAERIRDRYKNLKIEKGNLEGEGKSQSFASLTPEDKFGPAGYDAPNTPIGEEQRFITDEETFNYRVDFWNEPDATVPTQIAIIKDQLDPNLDWDTFNFTNFGFLDWNIDVPGGQTIEARVDMRPKFDLAVDVKATFDAETGEIEWTFQAVDPVTGDFPEDPFTGFLPPFNEETRYELGWVEFTVDPKDNLATGTQISNQAFVQFDLVNDFNPAPKEGPWINTIDSDTPDSAVAALAETTEGTELSVSWSGTDVGSGIATYDIYVAENDGDFTLWLDDTTETTATYSGTAGQSYAFYSVSTDNVGLVELAPDSADTVTTILQESSVVLSGFDVTNDHVLLGQASITFALENKSESLDNFELQVIYSENDTIGDEDDVIVGNHAVKDFLTGESIEETLSIQLPIDQLNSRALLADAPNLESGYISNNIDYIGILSGDGDVLAIDDITYFPWDIDGSGQVTPSDAIYVINRLGQSVTSDNALADFDGSGVITPSDAIAAINRLGYSINSSVFE